jgi:acyl-CoA reductase-like NAD-dependent aldehyde dehydrogenase
MPLQGRANAIRKVGERLVSRGQKLADIVQKETGKSATDAWFADVTANHDLFTWWADHGPQFLTGRRSSLSSLKYPGKQGELHYEPKGLIGLITPWNYPVALPLRAMVPALLAGNGVLFKPSEVTPETGKMVAALFDDILPSGLIATIEGAADAGQAVIEVVDHVVFIGGVSTGRKVATQAAQRLISTSLELGGNDAAIVLQDCAFERTVQGILWGASSNSGQNCAAVERCYVETAIYERFVDGLIQAATELTIAPVATPQQDETIKRHLQDALDKGAKAHGAYPGSVVILTDVHPDSLVLQEETFGPLLPVIKVEGPEAALRAANATDYGLTTSIWTKDEPRARDMARRCQSGVVTINNVAVTASMPFAPWGGRGLSGSGVTNSQRAIMEMVDPKYLLVDHGKDPEPWWHPDTPEAVALAQRSLDWLAASPIGKISRTPGLLKAIKGRIGEQGRVFAKRLKSR